MSLLFCHLNQAHALLIMARIESDLHEQEQKRLEYEEQNRKNLEVFEEVKKTAELNMKRYYETGPGGWTDCAPDGILGVPIDHRMEK